MWFSVNSVNCKELITQVQQLEKHSVKGGKDSKKKKSWALSQPRHNRLRLELLSYNTSTQNLISP